MNRARTISFKVWRAIRPDICSSEQLNEYLNMIGNHYRPSDGVVAPCLYMIAIEATK